MSKQKRKVKVKKTGETIKGMTAEQASKWPFMKVHRKAVELLDKPEGTLTVAEKKVLGVVTKRVIKMLKENE